MRQSQVSEPGGCKLYNLVCAYPVLEYILHNCDSRPHAGLTSAMQGELGSTQLEGVVQAVVQPAGIWTHAK